MPTTLEQLCKEWYDNNPPCDGETFSNIDADDLFRSCDVPLDLVRMLDAITLFTALGHDTLAAIELPSSPSLSLAYPKSKTVLLKEIDVHPLPPTSFYRITSPELWGGSFFEEYRVILPPETRSALGFDDHAITYVCYRTKDGHHHHQDWARCLHIVHKRRLIHLANPFLLDDHA